MNKLFFFTATLTLTSPSAFSNSATSTQPSEVDLSTPKAAAIAFQDAKASGNAEKIQAVIADKANSPIGRLVIANAAMSKAIRDLGEEAQKQFGEKAKDFYRRSGSKEELVKEIEKGELKISEDGKSAVITLKDANLVNNEIHLKKVEGKWKQSLGDEQELKELDPEQLQGTLLTNTLMTEVAKKTLEELKAGQYKSFDEMIVGLNQHLLDKQKEMKQGPQTQKL